MKFFNYKNRELHAEDVPIAALAKKYGTPLYVYSQGALISGLNAYKEAFKGFKSIICFALKANSNAAVLSLLAKGGAGADIVSGGELFRALGAGMEPSKIIYAGVGKTSEEIRYALKSGILLFNVESFEELLEIDRVARSMRKKARVSLRVNPDIDPRTHPYISTGLRDNKFGIAFEEAHRAFDVAKGLKNLKVVGIHHHIGSQLTDISPFVEALQKTLLLIDSLKAGGLELQFLDIGGGLGIAYADESPPRPAELAGKLLPLLINHIKGRDHITKGRQGLTLIVEPGRSIAGPAGVLVTKALYGKNSGDKEFLIVDAAMNDLMRPSLYNAYHEVLPVRRSGGKKKTIDVVGPVCESGDFLAKGRKLQKMSKGDLLAVMDAGAYGFAMSSNYNSRPRVAEVMVKGKRHALVRERETYDALVSGECVPRL